MPQISAPDPGSWHRESDYFLKILQQIVEGTVEGGVKEGKRSPLGNNSDSLCHHSFCHGEISYKEEQRDLMPQRIEVAGESSPGYWGGI